MNITKEMLEKAENKYPANNFIKFWFDKFSTDKWNAYKITLVLMFIIFNVLAAFLKQFSILYYVSLFLANGTLALVVTYGFIMVTWNNIRIGKIAKVLGLSLNEYNDLVN